MNVTTNKCIVCVHWPVWSWVCKSLTVKINLSFPLCNCVFWKLIRVLGAPWISEFCVYSQLFSIGQMFPKNNAWVKSIRVDKLLSFNTASRFSMSLFYK